MLYDAEVIIHLSLYFPTTILRRTLSYYFMNKSVRLCHPVETDKNITEKKRKLKEVVSVHAMKEYREV